MNEPPGRRLPGRKRPGRNGAPDRVPQAEPVPVADVVAAIVADLGSAPIDAVTQISDALAGWLGPNDASRVAVRSLLDGELVLESSDARTAADLQYRGDELTAVLGATVQPGTIRKVRIVVRGRP